jgi:hypothetical protein
MNRIDADPGRKGSSGGIEVLRDAQSGKLRRKGNPDNTRDALRRELVDRLLEKRLPIPHADRDRHLRTKATRERLGLRERQLGQGRSTANRLVVVAHLGDEFR